MMNVSVEKKMNLEELETVNGGGFFGDLGYIIYFIGQNCYEAGKTVYEGYREGSKLDGGLGGKPNFCKNALYGIGKLIMKG